MAAVLALAIFIADTMSPGITFSVLYVAVVLMASNFSTPGEVWLVSLGCVGLTLLSYAVSAPDISQLIWSSDTLLALVTIGLAAFFAVQRQAAMAVAQEQASLLNLTHDPVFVRDIRSNLITYWNRSAENLYGWTAAEAIGKDSHQLLHTIFPVPLDEIMAELVRTGRWEGELVHTKRDGTSVILASRWSVKRDQQGRATAFLETNNDITGRKRTQERLRQSQEDLARVNRTMLMGELTASIAHEVKQPIAGVAANAAAAIRWLSMEPPHVSEATKALGRILRDCHRSGEIISRVRSLIKREPLRKDRVDVNESIQEVLAMVEDFLKRNHVTLRTCLSLGLPVVSADRIQFQQVVLNLITNAAEAMEENANGPRELAVNSGRHDVDEVFVEVKDSGPGLDPAHLDRLFHSFHTTKFNGMGMGLAISRSIIEAHGGRIWAEPNHPRGALFRFTLPARELSPLDKVPLES